MFSHKFHDFRVVVSNIFYFHPYFGKIPILTHIFQMGLFNHQADLLLPAGVWIGRISVANPQKNLSRLPAEAVGLHNMPLLEVLEVLLKTCLRICHHYNL